MVNFQERRARFYSSALYRLGNGSARVFLRREGSPLARLSVIDGWRMESRKENRGKGHRLNCYVDACGFHIHVSKGA